MRTSQAHVLKLPLLDNSNWQFVLSKLATFKLFTVQRVLISTVLLVCFTLSSGLVHAAIDVYEFKSEQQEAQYRHLIDEFRCPKCQNQNLAGSDSQIAQDLKRKTYEMVLAGQTDAQIRAYMYDRYGAFISYKPPVRPSTWILWFFPPLILVVLIGWWLWRNAHIATVRRVVAGDNLVHALQDSDNDNDANSPLHSKKNKHAALVVSRAATDSTVDSTASGLTAQERAVLKDLLQHHQADNASHSYVHSHNSPHSGIDAMDSRVSDNRHTKINSK